MPLTLVRTSCIAVIAFASPALAADGTPQRNWAAPPSAVAAKGVGVGVPTATATTTTPAQRAPVDDSFARNMSFIDQVAGLTPTDGAATDGATAAPSPPPSRSHRPFDLDGTGEEALEAALAPPNQSASGEADPIDLTALRYYASQNNIARVAAEIRRIKALHPDWEAPQTLFAETATVDEQPMWDLYGEGKLDAIYAMIKREKAKTPSYVPSSELVKKLKIAEGRRAIDRYAEANQWPSVIEVARKVDGLLVCPEMQTLWHVAEGLARQAEEARAKALYLYILNNCENQDERLATVQKASQVLSDTALDEVLAQTTRGVGSAAEIASLRLDRLRGKVGEAMNQKFGPKPSPEELQRLALAATTSGHADDAMLLGWYNYSQDAFDDALAWFDRSLQMKFSIKALEGYILSLREADKLEEAREIALEYNTADPAIAKLFLEIASYEMTDEDPAPVSADKLEVVEGVIEQHKSALGAQSYGWYLYNQKQPEEALTWFEKSLEWEPTAEGALGLAITRNKLGDRKGVEALAQRYGEDFPTLTAFVQKIGPKPTPRRVARAAKRSGSKQRVTQRPRRGGRRGGGGDRLMKEALQAYEAGNYKQALAKLDARKARRGETRDVAMLRGWALHNSRKYKKAYKLFTNLNKQAPSKKAREGARHSYNRMMPERFH